MKTEGYPLNWYQLETTDRSRMYSFLARYLREPVNALTHLAGVLLSVVALILLIMRSIEAGSMAMLAAFSVFGVSMILLYISSTLYHSIQSSWDTIKKLRKLDHMMIYVLIAGTFTPFCLVVIGGLPGIILLSIMWTMALIGIFMKLLMGGVAGWLSISIYIVMGWTGLALIPLMIDSMPLSGLIWMGIGGVIYTGGAVIYGLGKPDPIPNRFGYHEIWHLFVLGGTFSHFWAVYQYVAVV